MILFCLATHFNESVNAFGMVESADLGRLALPFSRALMFNQHKFVVFLFICQFSFFNFQTAHISPREGSNWCGRKGVKENAEEQSVWLLSARQKICKGSLGAANHFTASAMLSTQTPLQNTAQQMFILRFLISLSPCLCSHPHCRPTHHASFFHSHTLFFSLRLPPATSGSGFSLHLPGGVCLGHWLALTCIQHLNHARLGCDLIMRPPDCI